jgi:hypothetical protein
VQSAIVQTLLNHLPATRSTPNGWQSFNAPCCEHRGHNADRRRRGGVKLTGTGVAYNCFNCRYTTGYTVGGVLGIRFRRLLIWLGVSAAEVNALKIQALRDRELYGDAVVEEQQPQEIVEKALPDDSEPLDPIRHPAHCDYLAARSIDIGSYSYFVSEQELPQRIIVPFAYRDHLVGYTARAIGRQRPKYMMNLAMPYVFGQDLQQPNWTWCPVVEGAFDAISIGGCAVLGNDISEAQAEQLDSLDRTLVVVPDQDQAGEQLVQAAIDYGWSVSFPEWPADIKDVNDAVTRFGALFVTQHIWSTRVAGATQIRLRRKLRKHN